MATSNKYCFINTLPDDKNLAKDKLEIFADDNFNVAQKVNFFFGREENIVGKGENAGYHGS